MGGIKRMEDRERWLKKERGREIQRKRQSYIKVEIVHMRENVSGKKIEKYSES